MRVTSSTSIVLASALALGAATSMLSGCGFTDSSTAADTATNVVTTGDPFSPGGGSPPPPPANDLSQANVVVDASQPVSETGSDDLSAARRVFQGFGFPEANGGLTPGWSIVSTLNPQSVRIINSLDGCIVDGNGVFHSCPRLDGELNWAQIEGITPHVIVGQFLPQNMTGYGEAWDAATWAQYQALATATVNYVVNQYAGSGFPSAIFEVCNELNILQDAKELWFFDPNNPPPQGDPRRYNAELKLYGIWATAVDQVAKANPSRSVMIGGPAMGVQSLFMTNNFWHAMFINDVAAQGWRMDMVTLHYYDDFVNGFGGALAGSSSLAGAGQNIRQALNAVGRGNTPIFVTEWGPSDSSSSDQFGHLNYGAPSAAWGAGFLRNAMTATVNGGSILEMRDVFGADTTGNPDLASLTYVNNGNDYPKPYTNVFQMFTLIPGTRIAVNLPAAQPDVNGVAGASSNQAAAVIYNYNFLFNWPVAYTDLSVPEPVTLGFKNLPFNGPVSIDHYLEDATHGNVAQFIDAGVAPDPNQTQLQKIETLTGTVTNGNLLLPGVTLGPSAVSLWVVTPQ
jgi:hypothetical protein